MSEHDQSEPIKAISVAEFREHGYLQELNRRFLHPLGLALSVEVDEDTGEESFGEIWDYRDDPEGMLYAGGYGADAEKYEQIEHEWAARKGPRVERVGFMVQPLGVEPPA